MIKGFYIDNFKSLVDFRLPPVPHKSGSFTCLVGLNGAGTLAAMTNSQIAHGVRSPKD